jgi:hypothetical protein
MQLMRISLSRFLQSAAPALLLVLASCSRPAEGQVFVVTAGAGNYKLGLVPIFALGQSDYDEVKTKYSASVEALKANKQAIVEEAREKVATLRKKAEDDSRKRASLEQPAEEAEQQLLAFTKATTASMARFDGDPDVEAKAACQRLIEGLQQYGGLGAVMSTMTSASMTQIPQPLYDKLRSHLSQGTSGASPNANAIATELVTIAREYYSQMKKLYADYDKKRGAYLEALDVAVESENQHNDAVDLLNYAQQNLEVGEQEKHRLLADAVSAATPATKTDGDGNFKIENMGGARVLVAFGERKVGSDSETYSWIIPLNDRSSFSGDGKLILSNDNISSPDALLN